MQRTGSIFLFCFPGIAMAGCGGDVLSTIGGEGGGSPYRIHGGVAPASAGDTKVN